MEAAVEEKLAVSYWLSALSLKSAGPGWTTESSPPVKEHTVPEAWLKCDLAAEDGRSAVPPGRGASALR